MSAYDLTLIEDYFNVPEKYVYEFEIQEPNRVRKIITYNKDPRYGAALRTQHTLVSEEFRKNFYERNEHSFAYHKNIRCLDALSSHLKSHHFIKLDIHHFFESITYDAFMKMYGERFNQLWRTLIRGFFYKDNLSIGFVSSPLISDFYMSSFDRDIEEYISANPRLHYSRYSDDILLSSEEDDIDSLNEFYLYLVSKLDEFGLSVNEKKLRKESLSLEKHNSISFLGLNISKKDEINNKVTISKAYILFLLFLIEKNERYNYSCKELCDEINSRVAYLAYSSPVSFERFQKKHENIYGVRYDFTPKKVKNRKASNFASEIPDFSEYADVFQFNIHKKVVDTESGSVEAPDNIEIASYLGNDEVVTIPDFVDTIGKEAFSRKSVKKVVLHNHIRSIGQGAFSYCDRLEYINIPNSVKIIAASAFLGCKSLKSIVLPLRLRVLNASVFEASGISKVTFGDNLKLIASRAFAECKSLKEIVLPDSVDKMADSVFTNCIYLEKITLPKELIYVSTACFKGCASLKKVDLGDNIISVYGNAFENCFALKEVRLGKALANVGLDAFKGCLKLEKFVIDKENKVFDVDITHSLIEKNDKKLIAISKNTVFEDIGIIGERLFKSSQLKELILPEGIKEIKPYAFCNCALLEKVVLPKSLEVIGQGAFKDCVSLKRIEIPSKVKVFEKEVFANCFRLEEIKFNGDILAIKEKAFNHNKSLRQFDFKAPLEEIGYKAFGSCYSLEKIYIPETVKKLHKHAFANCSKNLLSIEVNEGNKLYYSGHYNAIIIRKTDALLLGCRNSEIPDGVVEILPFAFENCEELVELNLPASVKKIGQKAMQNCLHLRKITMEGLYEIEPRAFFNCRELVDYNFPESLTTIGEFAFAGCESIESVKFPTSIFNIGRYAFANCYNIKEIFVPKSILHLDKNWFSGCHDIKSIKVAKDHPNYLDDDNCNGIFSVRRYYNNEIYYDLSYGCINTVVVEGTRSIGSEAFKNCKGLEKIHLPASLFAISVGAFEGCRDLKQVTFDQECCLRMIDTAAFKGCVNLREIVLPKTINYIQGDAFYGCSSLVNVSLKGATLTKLGASAFGCCKNLKTFIFPDNYEYVEGGLFFNCSSIETIDLPDTVKAISTSAFMGCSSLKTIKLPDGLDKLGSKVFKNCVSLSSINLPAGLTAIPKEAFANTSIEKIEISEKINSIGAGAFMNCNSLKSVRFHGQLLTIGDGIFKNCPSLEEVIFDDEISYISKSMFEGCSSLEEIKIPKSATRISNLAFKDCASLKTVTLSTKVIDYDAFRNCKSLEKFIVEDNDALEFKDGALLLNVNSMYSSIKKESQLILATSKAVIPDDCRLISRGAFMGLDITSIDLKNVEIISTDAFRDCVKLKDVDLSRVVSIDGGAFINTNLEELRFGKNLKGLHVLSLIFPNSVKTIKIDKENERYSDEGCNVIYDKLYDTVMFGTSNSSIPSKTLRIGDMAFSGSSFEGHLDIPEGVLSIGNCCFLCCKGLKSVSIPSTVTTIAENAFEGCDNLEEIIVHKDNPYFYSDKANKALINKEQYCSTERSFVREGLYGPSLYALCKGGLIPSEVTNIRSTASLIDNPGHIYIPKQVTFLPALKYLNAEEIIIDSENPFYSDGGHNNVVIDSSNGKLIAGCKNSIIGDEVISIGGGAFTNCKELKSVHIGRNVVDIDKNAFLGCENLESITVDKNNPVYDSRDNSNMIFSSRTNKIVLWCKNSKLPEELNYEPKDVETKNINISINDYVPDVEDPAKEDVSFSLDDDDDWLPF